MAAAGRAPDQKNEHFCYGPKVLRIPRIQTGFQNVPRSADQHRLLLSESLKKLEYRAAYFEFVLDESEEK